MAIIISHRRNNKRVITVKKRNYVGAAMVRQALLVVMLMRMKALCCFFLLSSVGSGALVYAQATDALGAEPNRQPIYLVSVPMIGLLLHDIYGSQIEVMVISESLDYHSPQVTPKLLQSWERVDGVIWLGKHFEPQMSGIISKVIAQSDAAQIILPVTAEAINPESRHLSNPGKHHDETNSDHPHQHYSDHHYTEHSESHHTGKQFAHKANEAQSIHKDIHRSVSPNYHGEHAHPWLDVAILKLWVHWLTDADQGLQHEHDQHVTMAARNHLIAAVDGLIKRWQSRFNQLENRSFVEEHAALAPITQTFALNSVGALTNHHDTTIGVREMLALKKAIREYHTSCYIAMMDSQIQVPPTLFPHSPTVKMVDVLGRESLGQASIEAQQIDREPRSTALISGILSQLYACMSTQSQADHNH